MTRRRVLLVLGFALTFVVVLSATIWLRVGAGYSLGMGDQETATPIATANLGSTGPGSLVSALTAPGLTSEVPRSRVRSARIVYRSTEGDTGAATEVSGMAFVPMGEPPEGGWPVVAVAHGSTGIDTGCAPSLDHGLAGQGRAITGWVTAGYAVALPDYQGLGQPGVHPYHDSKTAGFNLIDAVRALRLTFPDVSTKWAGYGASQGGGAVWSANEQASTYAPELQLVGTAAIAPSTNPVGYLDKAESGTLTKSQAPVFIWQLTSLHRLHPEIDLDHFRRGVAAQYWDAISACSGSLLASRDQAWAALTPGDLIPDDEQAAQQVRELWDAWVLPQRPLSAPLSVLYGDDDAFIDLEWIQTAIASACAAGGTVVWTVQPGGGHDDLNTAAQVSWIGDRFAGRPLQNYCS